MAAVSQGRRGGRKREEASGGLGGKLDQKLGFGPFIHLDINMDRWISPLNG
jgi:hypothetical protein